MRFDHMDFVDIFMSVFIKHSATISTRLEVANNYWLSTHLNSGRYYTSEGISLPARWELTSIELMPVFIALQFLGCLKL